MSKQHSSGHGGGKKWVGKKLPPAVHGKCAVRTDKDCPNRGSCMDNGCAILKQEEREQQADE